MKTLNFSININAPREKVWNTMLQDTTYRAWTKPFNGNSHYKGDWSEGSKMIFLGTEDNSKDESGMVSRIAKNTPHEYISIQHQGMITKGVEELWGEDKYGYENYTFSDKDGGTQLDIEMTNIPEEYCDDMGQMWPKALAVLKSLSENGLV